MRVSVPLLTILGTAAGAAAAVVAYQTAAGSGPAPQSDTATNVSPAPARAAATTWLPCEKGTRLHRGVCVKVKHKVVVVNDPAPAYSAAALEPAPAAKAGPARPGRSAKPHGASEDGNDASSTEQPTKVDEDGADDSHENPDSVEPPEPGDD